MLGHVLLQRVADLLGVSKEHLGVLLRRTRSSGQPIVPHSAWCGGSRGAQTSMESWRKEDKPATEALAMQHHRFAPLGEAGAQSVQCSVGT